MGCLTAYARSWQDGKLLAFFDIDRLVNRSHHDWHYYPDQADLCREHGAVWLLSSYVWNHADNLDMAREIKRRSPSSLVIVGGPHIPAYEQECHQFLDDHPYVDVAVRGEGEITLVEILEVLASRPANSGLAADLSSVSGLTFRHQAQVVRTPDRARSKELSSFPSPFLSGEFDDPSFDKLAGMVLETNRGCPYGCTYCDWGAATLQKVRHFDLERVKQDIEYIASKHPYNLHLADANFGAFARDIDIAKAIVAAKKKYGFPKKFASSNAKNASPIIGEVIKILTEGGLITQGAVAIRSVDDKVLKAVHRSNIKTANFEKLMGMFKQEQLVLTSELLLGLPGQTYQSHKHDLQYVFDRKITTLGYQVQMMPNAPMNEPGYREKHQIRTNANGFVIATSAFSEQDLTRMHELFLAFQYFYMLGVAKYFLYYLQIEHRINSLDYIDAVLSMPEDEAQQFPLLDRTRRDVIHQTDPRNVGVLELQWKTEDVRFLFDDLDAYYEEIIDFAACHFQLDIPDGEPKRFGVVAIREGREVGPDGIKALHQVAGSCSAQPGRGDNIVISSFGKVLTAMTPEEVIKEVKDSGQRGRGGAGMGMGGGGMAGGCPMRK